jgi:hypothetical protein
MYWSKLLAAILMFLFNFGPYLVLAGGILGLLYLLIGSFSRPKREAPMAGGFVPDLDTILNAQAGSAPEPSPSVGYTLLREGVLKLAGQNLPEQEQVILKILNRALSNGDPVVSEEQVYQLVFAAHRSGALKTKKDPGYIFRHYAADLMKRGVLRRVDIRS